MYTPAHICTRQIVIIVCITSTTRSTSVSKISCVLMIQSYHSSVGMYVTGLNGAPLFPVALQRIALSSVIGDALLYSTFCAVSSAFTHGIIVFFRSIPKFTNPALFTVISTPRSRWILFGALVCCESIWNSSSFARALICLVGSHCWWRTSWGVCASCHCWDDLQSQILLGC